MVWAICIMQLQKSSTTKQTERWTPEKLLADILIKEKLLQERWLKASNKSEREQCQAHLKTLIQAKQAIKAKIKKASAVTQSGSTSDHTAVAAESVIESPAEELDDPAKENNAEPITSEPAATPPKREKHVRGKNIAIAAALLLVTSTGIFISQSNFDFRQWLAQFGSDYQQQASHIAQLEAEINELIARLNATDQDLKDNVAAAEKELQGLNTTNGIFAAQSRLASHQAVYDLTQQVVFQGSDLAGLREKKIQTDILVQENQFQQAIPALEEIKQGYLGLLLNLDSTNPMFAAQKEALAKQSDWLDFKRKYEMGPIKSEVAVKNLLHQANNERDEGEFILAHTDYQSTGRAYQNLLNGPEAREAIAAMNRRTIIAKLKKEMVRIPGGNFVMGDLTDDGETDEKPTRKVIISDFALKKTEVTFEQYDMFADATGHPRPDDGGWGRGNRPVINVNWHDAVAFTEWLSKETGKNYRLPTEAEWEYAARAGSKEKYSWGNKPNAEYANGSEKYDWPKDGFHKQTAPVATYKPNQFGLHDMHGNVLEWTQDCWKLNYELSAPSGRAWVNGDCSKRVRRGGSWVDPPLMMRSSERFWSVSTTKSSISGFRLAQDVRKSKPKDETETSKDLSVSSK